MKKSVLCSLAVLSLAATSYADSYAGGKAWGTSGKSVVTGKGPVVQAEPCLTYDFLDLQYLYTDYDGLDEGNGVAVNFSKGLFGQVYLTATADWIGTEIYGYDADAYGATVGLGYYIPVSDRFHLNIEASLLYSGLETPWGDSDEWGGAVGPGFRYCLTQDLELFGNAYYTFYESGYDAWDFNAGVVWKASDLVGLKFSGVFSEDGHALLGGIRIFY